MITVRATVTMPNGSYCEMRMPSEVKAQLGALTKTAVRMETLRLCETQEYLRLYAQYRLLNWYLNRKANVRKLVVYNYLMFEAVPDIGEPGNSVQWYGGCKDALEFLVTRNPSGLIKSALPVQQSF